MWMFLTGAALAFGIPAVSGAIQIEQPGEVVIGSVPTFTLRVPDAQVVFYTECTASGGGEKKTIISPVLEPGESMAVPVTASSPTVTAECLLVANFANGLSERRGATISWTWVEEGTEK
ncbi:MAG: hypothetical protein ACI8S6_004729 [Myxococcota bacterium]|jgi:hypothetical protein